MVFNHKWLNLVLISSVILVLTACGDDSSEADTTGDHQQEQAIEPQFDVQVENFNYTNQDGEQVSLDDLKGTYWVADFIFTSCETVCPPMTANMSKLQQKLEEEGLDVRLVSFSVDPHVDDQEALKEFGDKFGADYSNWDFLTGYDQKEIESFAADSFKTLVSKVDGNDQVNHGTSFMIVNPEGKMINRFKGTSLEEMDQIVKYLNHYMN
ncbi:SCO family protein [Tenuibacillus multivorans]|uniref:Protein SCO1/2 n=1 Tax=Tenuibacillus multivorans TaxID=237069 RepID=A0A1G9YEB6_9BACI|nr:SCO family protein [Tenuibacillus multivorans]GEL76050.1 SCO1 protein [Tenuibacillus multivorans]SDN06966.1 protein SCO1/2 [Tenuibacillus multivorans]